MAEFPAWPLWTDAYLADTTHLSTIEHGAYLLLLMALWRNRGWLPNDDVKLCRFARLRRNQWVKMRPTIMAFFDVDGDRITQARCTDEWERCTRLALSQSRKAKARWLKKRQTDDAGASERHMPSNASLPLTTIPPKDSPPAPSEHPPQGGNGKPNGSAKQARGARLTEDWEPEPEAIDHCKQSLGCSADLINSEWPAFQCHFLAATGTTARKLDWNRTFINWMRRARKDELRQQEIDQRWQQRRGQQH